ncbi:MAG: hypothetical protein PHG25_01485 [Candidatus Pacebacteria bacterium]|nr:hypothetical protein [Candidatus Paceibacterota bacterium]
MKNPFPFLQKKNNPAKMQAGYVKYSSLIGNDAFADWALIILATCLIAGALIGVGGYVYVETQAELNSQGSILPASAAAANFDVVKLKSIITTFDARTNERVMLGKGYVGPKDPSLP